MATRDDREVVRARLNAQDKCSKVKTQIVTLLKRNGIARPADSGTGWNKAYCGWLDALAECDAPLWPGARINLASLRRQMRCLEEEVARLDAEVAKLARQARYAKMVRALQELEGVGPLTAMVFVTEIGDMRRFENRREIANYLGLVPSSFETGESDDRKGRITRQGPARVRKVLCQAAWNRVRFDQREKTIYERIKKKNPGKAKKAVVAAMRRLGIRMWHKALDALSADAQTVPA
jgi:transposase